MATHSNVLTLEIPRTEEPGRLQRVAHESVTKQQQKQILYSGFMSSSLMSLFHVGISPRTLYSFRSTGIYDGLDVRSERKLEGKDDSPCFFLECVEEGAEVGGDGDVTLGGVRQALRV